MRRRVFWTLAAATAAMAFLAGAGTFGFFSSTQTSPGNSFTAGTLVINVERAGTFFITAGDMQPGDSLNRTIAISRDPTSSLNMNYTVELSSAAGALCDSLDAVVTRTDDGQADNGGAVILAGAVVSAAGDTLTSFAATPVNLGSLNHNPENQDDVYQFQVTFRDTGAPQNLLQGASCTVGYTWNATQQTPNRRLTTGP